jgi:hypothetical protein
MEEKDYYNLRMAADYFEAVKMSYKCFYELGKYMDKVHFRCEKISSLNNKNFMHVALFTNIEKISFGNLNRKTYRYDWRNYIDIKDLSRYLRLKIIW